MSTRERAFDPRCTRVRRWRAARDDPGPPSKTSSPNPLAILIPILVVFYFILLRAARRCS